MLSYFRHSMRMTPTTMTLTLPVIHMNGTSRERLMDAIEEAYSKVGDAMSALAQTAPNGRDYYPAGPEAFEKAIEEHMSRVARLQTVREELEFIANETPQPKI
jgi:hypothetical protein